MSQEETDYAWPDKKLREFIKKRVIFASQDDNAAYFPDRHVQTIIDAFQSHFTAQLEHQLVESGLKAFNEEKVKQHQVELLLARIDSINQVFEMFPSKSFNLWKPIDAFRFYERLKTYEQQLKAELNKLENEK